MNRDTFQESRIHLESGLGCHSWSMLGSSVSHDLAAVTHSAQNILWTLCFKILVLLWPRCSWILILCLCPCGLNILLSGLPDLGFLKLIFFLKFSLHCPFNHRIQKSLIPPSNPPWASTPQAGPCLGGKVLDIT